VIGLVRRRAITVGLVGLIAISTACARPPSSQASQHARPATKPLGTASDTPSDLRDQALAEVEGEYGKVLSVYAEDDATQADWRKAEPNNTSGLVIEAEEDTKPVHFVFITGDFFANGPACSVCDGPVGRSFDEGRIVYDDSGQILNLMLWLSTKTGPPRTTGVPPFGPEYDND
jgi:hypothetical protein